jgi:hypothetical protein
VISFANFRNAGAFDPEGYDYQSAGGLPRLLRQAIEQEALRPGSNPGAGPNPTFNQSPNWNGNPRGLFGRLLAIQGIQGLASGGSSGVLPAALGIGSRPPDRGWSSEPFTSEPAIRLAADESELPHGQPVVIFGGGQSLREAGRRGPGLITQPYSRPPNASTQKQKAGVQGVPCSDCGKIEPKMYVNHIDPLVVEYYRNGTIDTEKMRSPDAVNAHCPTCSARQGGILSAYSKAMRRLLGLEEPDDDSN